MSGHTVATLEDSDPGRLPEEQARPALVLVLNCQSPMSGGACFDLEDVTHITIGRGTESVARAVGRGELRVDIDDSRMSAHHATIDRSESGWTLIDEGSTNGTRHNGHSVRSVSLDDLDVLQLGHTLLMFRTDGVVRSQATPPPAGFATLDAAYARQLARLERIATTPISVLLIGETGTGKEVIAQSLHELSGRAGPIVAVNCGAIPENLIESQLFGHEKGAFSGADRSSLGFVRAADGGTLFLDEVGELPLHAQVSLLRVLQEHEVVPVGATKPVPVRLRIIAATHQPLKAQVDAGTFRSDLYGRLAGFRFELPPLRERIVDLGLLIAAILPRTELDTSELRLRPEVGAAMLSFPWPQNIRQLQQSLLAGIALCEGSVLRPGDMPDEIRTWAGEHPVAERSPSLPPPLSLEESELREQVVAALRQAGGNVSEAARAMGKARQQIQRWVRRFSIRPEDYDG